MLVSSPECTFSDAILPLCSLLISFPSHHVLFRGSWKQSLTLLFFLFFVFVFLLSQCKKSAQQPASASCSRYFKIQFFKTAKSNFLEADETFLRNPCLYYHFLLWNFQNTSTSTLTPSQICKWTKFTHWLWMLMFPWKYGVCAFFLCHESVTWPYWWWF